CRALELVDIVSKPCCFARDAFYDRLSISYCCTAVLVLAKDGCSVDVLENSEHYLIPIQLPILHSLSDLFVSAGDPDLELFTLLSSACVLV
ncbi:hypothetical protein, partial [Haloarcula laminariae]|uniref:hypothetical protein n=1 Tax=Haloarcula laminariae TaxID=2961577 RepID=UPI0024072860